MGDLEQITIELTGIGHQLADMRLAVPVYQRSYAWTLEEVNELFQDLATAISNNEKEYFLGSVVVAGGPANPEVIDGQQRLATTSILIAAVRDYFARSGDLDRASEIESKYLLVKDLRTRELSPRLKLNQIDRDFFQKIVLSKFDSTDRRTPAAEESHKRIKDASKAAAEKVQEIAKFTNKPVDSLLDWLDYVDTQAKVIWVTVPNYANAFTIFETLNDRGMALAVSDLLKNYLFGEAKDRIEEVQQRWMSMLGSLKTVGSEDLTVTYIRQLWSSMKGLTREKELYAKIKRSITSKQAAVDFAGSLSNKAHIYAAMLNPDHDIWNQYGTVAANGMSTLNDLGMIQMRPLILSVLGTFSPMEVTKTIMLLNSWAVRFLIVGGLGGGTLENYYCQRAQEVTDGKITTARGLGDAMSGIVPSDRVFASKFETSTVSKANLARYYLRTIEQSERGILSNELTPNPSEHAVNLEHILPQNPGPGWEHIDAETVKAYSNRIGNLAILQTKLNTGIGNDDFNAKKIVYRKSLFTTTSMLTEYDTWGIEEIENRQMRLSQMALKAWPLMT